MIKVRFEPAQVECEAIVGDRLVDVTDDHPDSDVPYSCRSASCGTCRVEVLVGQEGLEPPDEDEREVLELFGDGPTIRLCCQLKIAREVEEIALRVCDD